MAKESTKKNKPGGGSSKTSVEKKELVITERWATQRVIQKADLVTEMKDIKHYYRKGVEENPEKAGRSHYTVLFGYPGGAGMIWALLAVAVVAVGWAVGAEVR